MAELWPGATPADWIDDLGHAIAERYRRIEDALHASLRRYLEQALEAPEDLVARHAAVLNLRLQAEEMVRRVSPEAIARLVTQETATAASAEISRMLLDFPTYNPTSSLGALSAGGAYAVAAVELDLRDALRALNARILRAPVDAYQAMTSRHIGDLLAGVTTSQAMHRRILDEYLAQGITGFTDVSGRNWTIGHYSEMATRSAAARAWRDQSVASMTAAGIDTFTPVIGASACEHCAAWEGKVVTDGGPTGPIVVQHAVTAEPTTIHVDGTIQQAQASGWGHPNCRCVWVPGLPGGPDPTEYSTHDPVKQQQRETLRELEQSVRNAKRKDDSEELAAARKALRKHVKDTGIIRRRFRELLSFADGHQ